MAFQEFTTTQTTDQVEAEAKAYAEDYEGDGTRARIKWSADVQAGDGLTLTAADGAVFIGEVRDVDEPEVYPRYAWIDLT